MFKFARLRDDSWGVQWQGSVQPGHRPGASVNVRKADGSVHVRVLGKKIWEGTDRDGKPCVLYTLETMAQEARLPVAGYDCLS